MKTNAIVRIILFSVVIILLAGLLIAGMNDGSLFTINVGDSLPGGTISSSGTVDAGTVTALDIEWAAGSITIQPGETDTITFAESGNDTDKYQMVWKQSGNKLTIQYSQGSISVSGLNFDSKMNKDLVVTVPQNWICTKLEIAAASADVYVSDLAIHDVEFEGASGVCTFTDCDVDEISLDAASGDIHFSGRLNILDCDAASADCTVVLSNIPQRIDMDTASGDLDLTLPANCGFTVTMDAMSSNFHSDFPTTMQGGSYLYGDGSCRIDVDALSGDVTIRMGDVAELPTQPPDTK